MERPQAAVVVGGAGLAGRYMLRRWKERLTKGNSHLKLLSLDLRAGAGAADVNLLADLRDPSRIEDILFKEYDVKMMVIAVKPPLVGPSYQSFMEVNMAGLCDLVNLAERYRVGSLVYVSSFAACNHWLPHQNLGETDPAASPPLTSLRSPYDLSKAMAEQLQESVKVVDPVQASEHLEELSEEMGSAKVVLVILTQGILTEATFAGSVAACPEEVRGNFVPIKADENFVYPDPAFWEKLAEGKIFSAETLAAFLTDFEGVRAAYARLFNVLALKFTSHGSESIQATEIHVMKGRLESMIHDSPVEKSTSTISKQRSQRSNTGSAPVAPAVVAPVSSIISADYDKAEVYSAEL